MNRLLLCPELFASEGGIPRILRLYLRALCEEAAATPDGRVSLAVLNDKSFPAPVVARYANNRLGEKIAGGGCKLRFSLAALRLGLRADHIVCGHVRQLFIARVAKFFRPSLNYFLVAHGIEVWRPFGPLERTALRGARRIFCVSDYTRREMIRNCPGLRAEQLAVLPNALDPAFTIAAAPPRANAHVIFTLTRLDSAETYKGVDHLIAALPLIRRELPDARLRIAGTGNDLPRLKALAQTQGVADAVEFLGFVEESRLTNEFKACDLFALPSGKEGFGLVFLEAMAHGKACLGARAGGVPEVITDDCGTLVDYGDGPGLAAAGIAALRRTWNINAILDRARYFSYDNFRTRLAALW
ncbi:MAG TPA: glycosyltransferase family 4 protein [Opitutaceae bacterium]|jgi:phosphatidylinositol alpha-1,6-mannosyltransferase|nr:glycosyltransferase family 4 protein [Opitutaceae bacterium]